MACILQANNGRPTVCLLQNFAINPCANQVQTTTCKNHCASCNTLKRSSQALSQVVVLAEDNVSEALLQELFVNFVFGIVDVTNLANDRAASMVVSILIILG